MVRRRNDEWSSLRVSGILAWVHRLVMLVTFPLRRFWLFMMLCLAFAAVLVIIPLYKGVPFGQIGAWYQEISPWQKWIKFKNQAVTDVAVKFEAVENTVAELSAKIKGEEDVGYAQTSDNERVKLVAWPVAEFKRARYRPKLNITKKQPEKIAEPVTPKERKNENFKALKAPPMRAVLSGKAKKIEEKRQEVQQTKEQKLVPPHALFYHGKLTDYYERLENRNLIYIQEPDILYGRAIVSGANSMSIDGTFFFLYGIYTDSRWQDPVFAERYLYDLTAGKSVYCAVVAYAANTQAPTALCFVDGIFINRLMVEHNLADNVGLK